MSALECSRPLPRSEGLRARPSGSQRPGRLPQEHGTCVCCGVFAKDELSAIVWCGWASEETAIGGGGIGLYLEISLRLPIEVHVELKAFELTSLRLAALGVHECLVAVAPRRRLRVTQRLRQLIFSRTCNDRQCLLALCSTTLQSALAALCLLFAMNDKRPILSSGRRGWPSRSHIVTSPTR
jgi:hypothetical protein